MKYTAITQDEDGPLLFAALLYYLVMIAAFLFGLYGFFSLFWLASAEVQRSIPAF